MYGRSNKKYYGQNIKPLNTQRRLDKHNKIKFALHQIQNDIQKEKTPKKIGMLTISKIITTKRIQTTPVTTKANRSFNNNYIDKYLDLSTSNAEIQPDKQIIDFQLNKSIGNKLMPMKNGAINEAIKCQLPKKSFKQKFKTLQDEKVSNEVNMDPTQKHEQNNNKNNKKQEIIKKGFSHSKEHKRIKSFQDFLDEDCDISGDRLGLNLKKLQRMRQKNSLNCTSLSLSFNGTMHPIHKTKPNQFKYLTPKKSLLKQKNEQSVRPTSIKKIGRNIIKIENYKNTSHIFHKRIRQTPSKQRRFSPNHNLSSQSLRMSSLVKNIQHNKNNEKDAKFNKYDESNCGPWTKRQKQDPITDQIINEENQSNNL